MTIQHKSIHVDQFNFEIYFIDLYKEGFSGGFRVGIREKFRHFDYTSI